MTQKFSTNGLAWMDIYVNCRLLKLNSSNLHLFLKSPISSTWYIDPLETPSTINHLRLSTHSHPSVNLVWPKLWIKNLNLQSNKPINCEWVNFQFSFLFLFLFFSGFVFVSIVLIIKRCQSGFWDVYPWWCWRSTFETLNLLDWNWVTYPKTEKIR